MSFAFNEDEPKFRVFKHYFIDNNDNYPDTEGLSKLYISKFNGWLSEVDYVLYIEKSSDLDIKMINEMRLKFFLSFFDSSVVFDSASERFLNPKSRDEFENRCVQSLDNSEDFLIVDYDNWVAINTSYDFTDICYFSNESDLTRIEAIAKDCGLYAFRDSA